MLKGAQGPRPASAAALDDCQTHRMQADDQRQEGLCPKRRGLCKPSMETASGPRGNTAQQTKEKFITLRRSVLKKAYLDTTFNVHISRGDLG